MDVDISLTARDSLEELPPDVQQRIKSKILSDVVEEPHRYIEPLSGRDLSKIRVGDYRVLVEWDRDAGVLKIHDVGHRSTIYDRD